MYSAVSLAQYEFWPLGGSTAVFVQVLRTQRKLWLCFLHSHELQIMFP